MAAPKLSKAEREERLDQVSSLYVQGMSQRKIAAELKVTVGQVWYDIKRVRETWKTNTTRNFDLERERQLAECSLAAAEAWAAWKRSIGEVKITRTEIAAGGDGEPRKKLVTTTELQAGDPRYLQIVLECIRRRCEILGLDAPLEAKLSGRLTIDDLQAILAAEGEAERPAIDAEMVQ